MQVLDTRANYRSLSIRDLLEARDLYHFHLMNKANVVGTAIGLYLIRDQAPHDAPRTLSNAHVQPASWPCVLVFVRQWLDACEFSEGRVARPTDMAPKTLYMPDGRAVPVCVVQALPTDEAAQAPVTVPLPNHMLGGGLPLSVHVQGVDRSAAIGCLVSDGHLTYALTARHACGPAGTPVSARLRGRTEVIGHSAGRQLTRLPFSEVYPDYGGRQSFLALDIGLVQIDDLNAWTSNVYGLPATGALADVYEQNLTLQLIDQPVVAHGPASGLLRASIKGLFYRYRSVGGYDYVGDLLIAPVPESRSPVHGDSGSVWHLDVTEHAGSPLDTPLENLQLRPLALLWGGQTFDTGATPVNFSVATTLSNACKLLDVELVQQHNAGVSGYWGRMGHYSIAAYAIDMVSDPDLRQLLQANRDNITFELDTLASTTSRDLLKDADFVPLADVADEVWKKFTSQPGGRDVRSSGAGRTTGPEHPNHYADVDFPYRDGKSLRTLCLEAPDTFFTPAAFTAYYQWLEQNQPALGGSKADPFKQGLLPFRVWQIFQEMVRFGATVGAVDRFVAAAGIVAHYLGDACQPLHGSVYADGDPSRTKSVVHPVSGKTDEGISYASGVHACYETAMIDRHKSGLFEAIGTQTAAFAGGHGQPLYGTGRDAGLATIALMDEAASQVPPLSICDAFERLGAKSTVAVQDGLYEEFGAATADIMARGARALACFWDSAWKAANAGALGHSLDLVEQERIKTCYQDRGFLTSLTLAQIAEVL